MKTAFIYAGQGSQYVGMGRQLYERVPIVRDRLQTAERRFGGGLLDAMFNDSGKLDATVFAQPAIYALSAAVVDALRETGVHSDGCAGLSLGEYVAFYDAGVYTFEDGFDIVAERGRLMAETARQNDTMLVAFLGRREAVSALLEGHPACHAANFNLETQTVVGGPKKAMERLMQEASLSGVKRTIRLAVEGAFHTPYMEDAERPFRKHVEDASLRAPDKPLYLNIDGRLCKDIPREQMVMQMTRPVRFHEMIGEMVRDGFDTFVEIGPGATLSGLVRKIATDVETMNIDAADAFHTAVARLKEGMMDR